MATLITLVIFGILVATFATQNTTTVDLNLGSFALSQVPLYLVVLVSALVGLFLAGIISAIDSLYHTFILRGKDHTIHKMNEKITHLEQKVANLEGENQQLKNVTVEERITENEERMNPIKRLRHKFAL